MFLKWVWSIILLNLQLILKATHFRVELVIMQSKYSRYRRNSCYDKSVTAQRISKSLFKQYSVSKTIHEDYNNKAFILMTCINIKSLKFFILSYTAHHAAFHHLQSTSSNISCSRLIWCYCKCSRLCEKSISYIKSTWLSQTSSFQKLKRNELNWRKNCKLSWRNHYWTLILRRMKIIISNTRILTHMFYLYYKF